MSPKLVGSRLLFGLGLVVGSAGAALAQGATITGVVTDPGGGPVAGVSVTVLNTTVGALTREDGRYTLVRVPQGVRVLEARRIGYTSQRRDNINVPDSGSLTVDFELQVSTLRLQTVVTTGVTDPTSGVKLPITVAKLTAEDLPVAPTTSAAGAIMGKVASARIVRSRNPGGGTSILLRTPTSQFKDNSPMFVVDGVILSQSFGGTTADIDALDIATIEVIKGASAAALYGAKAANGVVSITTNRGGDTPINTSSIRTRAEYGFNRIANAYNKPMHHPYALDANGAYLINPSNNRRFVDTVGTDGSGILDKVFPTAVYDHARMFLKDGQFQRTGATLSQNSLSTTFSASYNYQRDPGVIRHIDGNRANSFAVNIDHRARDFLRFSISARHNRSDLEPNPGSIQTNLQSFRADVDLLAPPRPGSGVPYAIYPDSLENRTNPLYATWANNNRDKRVRSLLSGEVAYTPLSWLTLEGNLSYDRSDRLDEEYTPRGLPQLDNSGLEQGEFEKSVGQTDGINAAIGLTALRAFGDLTARTSVRGLVEKEVNSTTTGSGQNFATTGVKEIDAGITRTASSSYSDVRAASGLVSTAIDYAGKYIVQGNLRYDGSSLFGPKNRWNLFYGLSGRYRLAEEPWWPVASLNEFSLRYSIGTGGTRPNFLDQYETLQLETGGGVVRRELGNPELRPEVATEQELALDMIYNNRVSLTLSAVRNLSTDNIIGIAPPAGSGYNTQEVNTGSIEGFTYEATLEAQLITRRDFQWKMDLVADRSSSTVKEFNRPCYGDGYTIRCEGYKISWIFGSRLVRNTSALPASVQGFADQFQVNDDGLLVWVGSGNTYQEGISKGLWGSSADIGGFTYGWGQPIALRDATGNVAEEMIGDFEPNGTFGLGNTFRYKGFSLYMLFTGMHGGLILNDAKYDLYNGGDHGDLDQSGKPEGLKKPVSYYGNVALSDPTDYFLEEGTWGKLTEVNLGFTVPRGFLSRLRGLGLDNARIDLVGRDLWWWAPNYSGLDPEVGGTFTRVDATGLPQRRNFTGVVTLTF